MKEDLRIIKTKRQLRQALLMLLNHKSLHTVTISELTQLAEVNRGTFYQHYRSINQLFGEYFEDILLELEKAYMQPLLETSNHPESIRPDMVRFFHHINEYQLFYRIVFDNKAPLTYYYKIFDTIILIMESALMVENSRFLLSYYANAILGIVLGWHKEGYVTSPEQLNIELLKYIK